MYPQVPILGKKKKGGHSGNFLGLLQVLLKIKFDYWSGEIKKTVIDIRVWNVTDPRLEHLVSKCWSSLRRLWNLWNLWLRQKKWGVFLPFSLCDINVGMHVGTGASIYTVHVEAKGWCWVSSSIVCIMRQSPLVEHRAHQSIQLSW